MKVLVAVASKHGATREIAEVVGEVLRDEGLDVTVAAPDRVEDVAGFDAAVIGSAVYAGRWLADAKALVEEHRETLRSRPVWLLSSGPVGEPPKPTEDPVDVADVVDALAPVEHRVLPGKIDRSTLGFGERAIVGALRVPEGDFRDWAEVRGWARGIARSMTGQP